MTNKVLRITEIYALQKYSNTTFSFYFYHTLASSAILTFSFYLWLLQM